VSSTTTDQFSTTETDATSIDPTTSTTFPSSSESTSTVITSTRLPTTSYECPSSDGNYPDPKSCLSYYTCSNGYPYIMYCPGGLVFNPIKLWCDWPFNVPECDSSITSTSVSSSTVFHTTTEKYSTTSAVPTTSVGTPYSSNNTIFGQYTPYFKVLTTNLVY